MPKTLTYQYGNVIQPSPTRAPSAHCCHRRSVRRAVHGIGVTTRKIEIPSIVSIMNTDTLLPDAKNPLIWINPGRVSGAPCFYKTRLPVDSLFVNIEGGISLEAYVDAFGISREQAVAVLEYAKQKMLATTKVPVAS